MAERRQNRRGLDDHLIIRFYTLTLESETPKGRGESAHTGKTDQRSPRDRGIRPVPEDRYPVYILCLGKSPPISIKDTSLGIIGKQVNTSTFIPKPDSPSAMFVMREGAAPISGR